MLKKKSIKILYNTLNDLKVNTENSSTKFIHQSGKPQKSDYRRPYMLFRHNADNKALYNARMNDYFNQIPCCHFAGTEALSDANRLKG